MPYDPLVSVIIPAYNCAQYLPAALESVLQQTYQALETIVVNDGSTDATSEVLLGYPNVIVIHQSNGGLSRARNEGIRKSRGEFVAFLDGDDIWPPEKLTHQVKFMQEHPEIGVLFGDARRFADNGWTEPTLFTRYGLNASFFGSDYLVVDPLKKLLPMNFIPVGTALVRRLCLFDAGLFDENFRRVEDWDLWLRIALRYQFAYSNDVWKLKRSHDFNLSNNTEAMAIAAIAAMEKLLAEHCDDVMSSGVDVTPHLRDAYLNLGYFYLRNLGLEKARRALSASLIYGTKWRSLLYWFATFFGKPFVEKLIQARG